MSIAMMLREGTAEKHQETEKVPYLRAIFKGGLDPQTYTTQLECFLPIYECMESFFAAEKSHPVLSKLYYPELNRQDALKEDIAYFQKRFGTKLKGSLSPKTKAYVEHIQNVAKSNPYLLSAQSYVRYLGDLSGGQAIKKVVARTFQLNENEGTQFYEFPNIADHQAFKGIYRTALDTLPLNETQKEELLAEAKKVFDLNKDLFVELDSDLKSNIGTEKYLALVP